MERIVHDETNSAWFWLWAEIARRFGQEEADKLRADYTAAGQRFLREQLRAQYAKDIPRLEQRRELAVEQGDDVYARRLEKMIVHRRKVVTDGWPDEQ